MTLSAVALFVLTLGVVWGALWRHTWLTRAARRTDAAIARNRARTRPGMERMDQALRDRTAQRRRFQEEALDEAKRAIHDGRPRLHRVS